MKDKKPKEFVNFNDTKPIMETKMIPITKPFPSIFEYDVITYSNLTDLITAATYRLQNGWKLSGGAKYSARLGFWHQTLTRG